jgi:hypothetical protein
MRHGSVGVGVVCAAIAGSSALFLQGTTWQAQAAPIAETPAVSCRAGNSFSADLLRWDHIRVWNPTTSQLWVVCPVTNNTEVYPVNEDELNLYGPSTGTLYAWFDASAAASAKVQCTWIDLTRTVTGGSTTNAVTHSISAPATRPGVVSQGFDLTLFNGFYSGTLTCRLDPNTGLNAYNMVINRELL